MDTTYTFTYHRATVTLARRTNRHALLIDRVLLVLRDTPTETPEGMTDPAYRRLFAEMIVQATRVEGDLGFVMASPAAPAAEIAVAYQRFLDGDGDLGDAFYQALKAVNAPPGPHEFLPPDELAESERKNSPAAGRSGAKTGAPPSGASPAAAATNPA